MAEDKPAKQRVLEKFNLANDIKESKIETSVSNLRTVDGKLTADFEISGLPVPKGESDSWNKSHKRIPKIFNDLDEFAAYAKDFFSKADDDIIKMCKNS